MHLVSCFLDRNPHLRIHAFQTPFQPKPWAKRVHQVLHLPDVGLHDAGPESPAFVDTERNPPTGMPQHLSDLCIRKRAFPSSPEQPSRLLGIQCEQSQMLAPELGHVQVNEIANTEDSMPLQRLAASDPQL